MGNQNIRLVRLSETPLFTGPFSVISVSIIRYDSKSLEYIGFSMMPYFYRYTIDFQILPRHYNIENGSF